MGDARHTQKTGEWGTPKPVIRLARLIMGRIDLDPASSPRWNRSVGAKRIWTRKDDGLMQPWSGMVFLNPPGTHRGAFAEWWNHLEALYARYVIPGFFLVGYNLDHLRNRRMDHHRLIVPRFRINYVGAGDSAGAGSFLLTSFPKSRVENALAALKFKASVWG